MVTTALPNASLHLLPEAEATQERRLEAVRCKALGAWDGRDTALTRLLHRLRPLYPFISFFRALRKRQSVPWAMICCGVDLIIPTSCRRRA
jgi:hypothetical protein